MVMPFLRRLFGASEASTPSGEMGGEPPEPGGEVGALSSGPGDEAPELGDLASAGIILQDEGAPELGDRATEDEGPSTLMDSDGAGILQGDQAPELGDVASGADMDLEGTLEP